MKLNRKPIQAPQGQEGRSAIAVPGHSSIPAIARHNSVFHIHSVPLPVPPTHPWFSGTYENFPGFLKNFLNFWESTFRTQARETAPSFLLTIPLPPPIFWTCSNE
ncbi:MAG TPA: hypothetical protein VF773_15700 [Verrucomicrobiae bacterium]